MGIFDELLRDGGSAFFERFCLAVIPNRLDNSFAVKSIVCIKTLVFRMHESKLKVNCWTVNEKDRAEELVKLGVDFITTNILE